MSIEKLQLELVIWEKMLSYIPRESKDTEDKIVREICKKLIIETRMKLGIINK